MRYQGLEGTCRVRGSWALAKPLDAWLQWASGASCLAFIYPLSLLSPPVECGRSYPSLLGFPQDTAIRGSKVTWRGQSTSAAARFILQRPSCPVLPRRLCATSEPCPQAPRVQRAPGGSPSSGLSLEAGGSMDERRQGPTGVLSPFLSLPPSMTLQLAEPLCPPEF